jgi:RNA polymerase sigma-70 factor, ECF subfamily
MNGGEFLREPEGETEFEVLLLPLLPSAYNFARWLLGDSEHVDDIVQEAFLRAYRFFPSFRGGDARAWLFTIVRNAAWSWIRANRPREAIASLDEARGAADLDAPSPEEELVRRADVAHLRAALGTLPAEFREVIVLREFEELSYREIAEIAGVPMGTVMSRLARGRARLQSALAVPAAKEART